MPLILQAQLNDIEEVEARLQTFKQHMEEILEVLQKEQADALADFDSENFKRTEREDKRDKERASKHGTLETANSKSD